MEERKLRYKCVCHTNCGTPTSSVIINLRTGSRTIVHASRTIVHAINNLPFNKRYSRDTLSKLSFLHTLFLKNKVKIKKTNYKVKIKKTNYTTMLFMTLQANPPKIRSILLRAEIRKYRESADRSEETFFFFFHQKNPFG